MRSAVQGRAALERPVPGKTAGSRAKAVSCCGSPPPVRLAAHRVPTAKNSNARGSCESRSMAKAAQSGAQVELQADMRRAVSEESLTCRSNWTAADLRWFVIRRLNPAKVRRTYPTLDAF